MAENNEPIQTQQAVQQWEYMDNPGRVSAAEFNKLGAEGWEAFCVGVDGGPARTMFKRPKPAKKQQSYDSYGYGR